MNDSTSKKLKTLSQDDEMEDAAGEKVCVVVVSQAHTKESHHRLRLRVVWCGE